jgi:hypothetical protein
MATLKKHWLIFFTFFCIILVFIIGPLLVSIIIGLGVIGISIFRITKRGQIKGAEFLALIGACLIITTGLLGIFVDQGGKFFLLLWVGAMIINLATTQREDL